MKSHHLPKPEYRNVVYLLRDGRDVLVSYWHYRRALGFTGSIESLIDEEHPVYGNWKDHVAQWSENPFGARIFFLKYEHLKTHPHAILSDLVDFLQINTLVDIETVTSWNDFRRLQTKEREQGLANVEWPRSEKFFRRGEAGAFKDEMSKSCERQFIDFAGDMMLRLGYL